LIVEVECLTEETVKKEDEYSFVVGNVKCVEVKKNCYNKDFHGKDI